jgi:hypothetical protein
MPDELPAWCTWLIRSTVTYFSSATESNPPCSPIAAKDAGNPARVSTVVPGRTSWS